MQRTEPAEPLITVIYKPDSTLMGRQNLPSPSFSPHFISPFLHPQTTPHLCSPSLTSPLLHPLPSHTPSFPLLHLTSLARFQCPSYLLSRFFFLPDHSCRLHYYFERGKGGKAVSWAGEYPRIQRKNVFLLFCTTSQYSLRSALGPCNSLGMAWDKAANNNYSSEEPGHS